MRSKQSSARGSFRVGRVTVYKRNRIWYLRYRENGKRLQPRASADRAEAQRLAAQVNVQLESSLPTNPSFAPISIGQLQRDWLDHHEHVKQSSVQTIDRYRTATQHLLNFVNSQGTRLVSASSWGPRETEQFARWLRTVEVAPNGHKNSAKRRLLDKGVNYILETCRTLFAYAIRQRHLPPYADNPFAPLRISAIAIQDAKPITIFSAQEEQAFLKACDPWEYPIFLTLMLTGIRPGELCHLLLPGDLDLKAASMRISNKQKLGWQIKTRNARIIPMHPMLVDVLGALCGGRTTGALFRQRRCANGHLPPLERLTLPQLERHADEQVLRPRQAFAEALSRREILAERRKVWRDLGAVDEDDIRHAFIRICRQIGHPHQTAPKVLRHGFATMLQEANVDPVCRNLLMGHRVACGDGGRASRHGLGMTAVYTHTRPETIRKQLLAAINDHWDFVQQQSPTTQALKLA